jgi:hypothetical protein
LSMTSTCRRRAGVLTACRGVLPPSAGLDERAHRTRLPHVQGDDLKRYVARRLPRPTRSLRRLQSSSSWASASRARRELSPAIKSAGKSPHHRSRPSLRHYTRFSLMPDADVPSCCRASVRGFMVSFAHGDAAEPSCREAPSTSP